MYARFLRWASDRLANNGVIAFVSNNSFIDARTYDGFRKAVAEEFQEVYIINLKGNARTSGERRHKEGGNIFNNTIRVGGAIYFLIRKEKTQACKIYYNAIEDYKTSDDKKNYLSSNKFQNLAFEQLVADRNNNWINLADNDFDSLLTLANKDTKLAKTKDENAVFKLFSLGVITARDEWVYDNSAENLEHKVRYSIEVYNQAVDKLVDKSQESEESQGSRGFISIQNKKSKIQNFSTTNPLIKWTRAVKNDLVKTKKYSFAASAIRDSLYRPFVKKKLYFIRNLNEIQYQLGQIFIDNDNQNLIICFTDPASLKPFMTLASNKIVDYHLVGDSQCLPLYRYDKDGNCIDNITDWGLEQFQIYYNDFTINKKDIFYYTYAILHNPVYRTKYELNLKREFPRLPFYNNFPQSVKWGNQLMDLHINYETVKPLPLKRIDSPLGQDGRDSNNISHLQRGELGKPTPTNAKNISPLHIDEHTKPTSTPKTKLKADKDRGRIILDQVTMLEGVPAIA